jgi:Tfp pilus assembly protein PilF
MAAEKFGRNEPCPCGSGKKFKHCHALKGGWRGVETSPGAEAMQRVQAGMNLQQAGDLDRAEKIYRSVLDSDPRHADALHLLGLLHHQRGKNEEAARLIERAIGERPGIAAFHNNCGEAYRAAGRYADALRNFDRAIALQPGFAEAWVNRGVAQKNLGDLAGAEASYREALRLRPDLRQAHLNLARVLRAQDRREEATQHYRHGLAIYGDDAATLNDLGIIHGEIEAYGEALGYFERALALDGGNADIINNRGTAHDRLLNLDAAVRDYRRAIELKPDFAKAYENLGATLYRMDRFDEAIEIYRHALSIDPTSAELHYNLALALFEKCQLAEGWKEYEYRFKLLVGAPERRVCAAPEWRGEDLEARSLLVWKEMGIGDEIWYAGMYEDTLARLGDRGRLIVECTPKLRPLLQRAFPRARVVPKSDPPDPVTENVDFHVPGGGLGRILRNSLADFPRRPSYLKPDPGRLRYWQNRIAGLGPGLKVGVSWRSSNNSGGRAELVTRFNQWGAILAVQGVHFINLQYDDCAAEIADAEARFGVSVHRFREVDMFDDLDETAALMAALDLVISAPTSVSILTGALGVPTWQFNYASNWQCYGEVMNPWLPAVRSVIRKWNESWDTVLEGVAAELGEVAKHGAGTLVRV